MHTKYQKKKVIKIAAGIVTVVIAVIILSNILSLKRELPVYVGKIEEPTTAAYSIETQRVEYANVMMDIPADWTYMIYNDNARYASDNGSYIDIISQDYYPEINTFLSENIVSARIASIGGTETGFTSMSSSCVYYNYQKMVGDTFYNVCSYISWDFSKIAEVDICIPAEIYGDYLELPEYLINKITCTKTSPISEDYYVYYESNTNTQFGVPITWEFANNGQITLYNGDASIIIGSSNITNFSSVTSIQYSQLTGNSVANFVLSSFNPSQNQLTAEANYNDNGTKMYMKQYMVNAGNISLVFTLTVPSSSMNNSLSAIFDTVTGYYQYWG